MTCLVYPVFGERTEIRNGITTLSYPSHEAEDWESGCQQQTMSLAGHGTSRGNLLETAQDKRGKSCPLIAERFSPLNTGENYNTGKDERISPRRK